MSTTTGSSDLESPDVEAWIQSGGRRDRRWRIASSLVVAATVLTGLAALVAISANALEVDDAQVTRVLVDEGLSLVRLGGPDLMGCEGGERSRHFWARRGGEVVEGTVCCGLTGVGKACTLRWDR